MRFIVLALALCACVSQSKNAPRKDKPMVVRVGPNGYELVEEDNLSPDQRRECSIEGIVGSHIPHMICMTEEQRTNERIATQNNFFISRNCRDAVKCDGLSPSPPPSIGGGHH